MLTNLRHKIYNFLRWTERYTKTDMVYLVKDGGWLLIGQIFSLLSGILLFIGLANILPKDIYGQYQYVLSIAGVIAILSLEGLNTSITKAVALNKNEVVANIIHYKAKFSLLILISSSLLAVYYFIMNNFTLGLAFIFIALFLPFEQTYNVYNPIFIGKKNFKVNSILTALKIISSNIFLIISIYFFKNLLVLIFLYFFLHALGNFIITIYTIRKYHIVYDPNNHTKEKNFINFGNHLSLINILASISYSLDKILVFHLLGSSNLAIYAMAINPLEYLKGFIKNINILALPKFTKRLNTTGNFKKSVIGKTLKFTLFTAFIALIYFLASPYIYKFLFPKYQSSIPYGQLYCLAFIPLSSFLNISYLESKSAIKELYILNLTGHIMQIILLIVLCYFLGIKGIILARIISRFAGWLLSFFLL